MKTINKMQYLLNIAESRLDNRKIVCANCLELLYKLCSQESCNADIYFNPLTESSLKIFNKNVICYLGKDLTSNQKDILNALLIYNRAYSSLQDITSIKKIIEPDYEDWEDYFLFTIYDKNANVYYDFVYEFQNGGYLNKYKYSGKFSEAYDSYKIAFGSDIIYLDSLIILVHNKNKIDELYEKWLVAEIKLNDVLIYIRKTLFDREDIVKKINNYIINTLNEDCDE